MTTEIVIKDFLYLTRWNQWWLSKPPEKKLSIWYRLWRYPDLRGIDLESLNVGNENIGSIQISRRRYQELWRLFLKVSQVYPLYLSRCHWGYLWRSIWIIVWWLAKWKCKQIRVWILKRVNFGINQIFKLISCHSPTPILINEIEVRSHARKVLSFATKVIKND